jgi:hypothetical protein
VRLGEREPTSIDGSPIPQHTDLAELSSTGHSAHVIHGDMLILWHEEVVLGSLAEMERDKSRRESTSGLKVFWSPHTGRQAGI